MISAPTPLLDGLTPHHVSIAVTDMDRAIEWYTSVLGFETEFRFHVAAIPADGAFLKSAQLRLELWCAAGAAPVPLFALFIRDPFGTLIEILDRDRLLEGNP